MEIRAIFLGVHLHIKGAGGRIDHRSGSNSNLRKNGTAYVSSRHRSNSGVGIRKVDLPKRRRRIAVRVERKNTVVLGYHKNHIVSSLPRNRDPLSIKRLPVQVTFPREVGV